MTRAEQRKKKESLFIVHFVLKKLFHEVTILNETCSMTLKGQ